MPLLPSILILFALWSTYCLIFVLLSVVRCHLTSACLVQEVGYLLSLLLDRSVSRLRIRYAQAGVAFITLRRNNANEFTW